MTSNYTMTVEPVNVNVPGNVPVNVSSVDPSTTANANMTSGSTTTNSTMDEANNNIKANSERDVHAKDNQNVTTTTTTTTKNDKTSASAASPDHVTAQTLLNQLELGLGLGPDDQAEWTRVADKMHGILTDMQRQWKRLDKARKAAIKSAKLQQQQPLAASQNSSNNGSNSTNNSTNNSNLSDSADSWKSASDQQPQPHDDNQSQIKHNTNNTLKQDSKESSKESPRAGLKRSGAQSDSDSAFYSTGGSSSSESRSRSSKRSKRK